MNLLRRLKYTSQDIKILIRILILFVVVGLCYLLFDNIRNNIKETKQSKEVYLKKQLSKISEEKQILGNIEVGTSRLKEIERGLLLGSKYLESASELQKKLRETAMLSDIWFREEKVLNPINSGDYQVVSVEVVFVSTLEKLRDLILNIEKTDAILSISNMKIEIVDIKKPKDINVFLTVKGFIKKDIKKSFKG